MKQDTELKLQAYLDGELPPAEAKAVADLLASDGPARDLLTELTNTRSAITAHEADIKVSASRDFYWSGIRREIERQEQVVPPRARETSFSIVASLRRMLVPVSGLAVVLLAVMLVWQPVRDTEAIAGAPTETAFADAGAFTYRDYDSGTTLVWVNYPAENEFAQMDLNDILEFD